MRDGGRRGGGGDGRQVSTDHGAARPHRGRHRRQQGEGAGGAPGRARGGCGPRGAARALPHRLPAAGPGAEARLRRPRHGRGRDAGGGDAPTGRRSASACPGPRSGVVYNVYAILAGRARRRLSRASTTCRTTTSSTSRGCSAPGAIAGPFRVGPLRFGTPICEDSWYPDVAEAMAESGAEILVVPNGSPFRRGKFDVRMHHMVARVVETGLPLAYVNMVGGQDDQVFDGGSFVLNPGGALAVQLPVFDEVIAARRLRGDGAGLAGGGRAARRASRADRAGLPGDGAWGSATTCARPGSPRCAARALGRGRQRAGRGGRGGRARGGERALRDAAVGVHLRAEPRGRRGGGGRCSAAGSTSCRSSRGGRR